MNKHARRGLASCLFLLLIVAAAASPAAAGDTEGFLILLTNDDGYNAPGLQELARALAPLGQVVVAAPYENQSGVAHATTTREFVRLHPIEVIPGVGGHAIEARPATCVRMALEALLPRRPDLVVSGINRGANLGIVAYYSGTLGAAREAVIAGVPAIAVSMAGSAPEDFVRTAGYVRMLVDQLRAAGRLRPGLFLNVNAPAGEPKGIRVVRQSTTAAPQLFTRYESPRHDVYFWPDYASLKDDEEGTDVWAVVRGFIAVVPLQASEMNTEALEWLQEMKLETEAAPAQ